MTSLLQEQTQVKFVAPCSSHWSRKCPRSHLGQVLGHTRHVADRLPWALPFTWLGSGASSHPGDNHLSVNSPPQGSGGLAFCSIADLWRRIQQVRIAGRAGWLPLNGLEEISYGPPLRSQIRPHFRFAFGNFTQNAETRKVAFGPRNPDLLQIVCGVWLASPRCLFKSWNVRSADRERSDSVTKLSF